MQDIREYEAILAIHAVFMCNSISPYIYIFISIYIYIYIFIYMHWVATAAAAYGSTGETFRKTEDLCSLNICLILFNRDFFPLFNLMI